MAYQPMSPCPSCKRHVQTGEAQCPFCRTPLEPGALSNAVPSSTQRMGRAATFVFATAIAASCSSGVDPADVSDGGGVDAVGTTDSAPTDAVAPDALGDERTIAPPYGVPPRDDGPDDNGNGSADYGSPPPMDGGNG